MAVLECLNQAWYNAFLCLLTLALFSLPNIVERRAKIDVPNVLEVIILLFIFAAEILGELKDFYNTFPHWDTILHTLNGFLCAAIGLSLMNILNHSPKISFQLTPFSVVLFAFCFSMTIGVLWEFFEYGMDVLFGTDMQKDTLLPDGRVDIGLIDTMGDLIVNFIGAVISSIFGYFYMRHSSKRSFIENFMLTRNPRSDSDEG
jgi:uncharacterized membrane protein YjdF